MAVPEVNKMLLEEIESMGFPQARAIRALHYSGNATVEDAINWIIDHENDVDIDEMPLVDADVDLDAPRPFLITKEMKIKAQKLRDEIRNRKQEEEKKSEREREKGRIRAGKELIEAKQIAEENERKKILAWRKAEAEEEKRAREKVLQKLEQDKVNRRIWLGLPQGHSSVKSSNPVAQEKGSSMPIYRVTKSEHLRDCLRSLKQNHKGDDARVRKAYETLLVYVRNVAKNPDEEKYRKIRLSNPLFQERVGSLNGGVEFLELCGFERMGDEYLYLPRDKVDMATLNSAGSLLRSAMTNPFFGVLSRSVM
ncbi:UBX domain-containing protein 1-like [Quillaja saponaria]|uniref:UBX domain-containing protein 1-like n=1 Tax=Quillaja saponaria TaxID=32244 RepID=A0AAD7PD13_QUISA|nr:UBX domain-containing protein 1-like [Quillaja saponaria]